MVQKKLIKIAFVIPNLKIAGAQKVVVKIASYINKNIFEPILFIMNEKEKNQFQKELDDNSIECYYFGKKSKNAIGRKVKQMIWLQRNLDEIKPDIIHVHLDYYFTFFYSLLKKKRIITTIHSQPYRICNKWTRIFMYTLDRLELIRIVCITEGGKGEFLQNFNVKESSVCVIPNPIEIEKYKSNRVFSDKEIIKFVYVARFEEIKNHHLLIKAFFEATKEIPLIQLYLVGEGPLIYDEKQFVKNLNIEKKVIFTGEINNVSEFLKEMDIFVISSDSESFSLSMVEAMASSLPIIATKVGAIPEIMDENGILVPPGDVKKLKEAIIKIYQNRFLRMKYSNKSFELAQKYDVKTVINKYEEIYCAEYKMGS